MNDLQEICKVCKKGKYMYGSGLYDYYSCGHAFEKPLNSNEIGRWISFQSPYEKNKRSNEK